MSMKAEKPRTRSLRALIILMVIALIGSLLWWKWASSPVSGEAQEDIPFSIERGQAVDNIAENLKEQKLIRSRAAFRIWVMANNVARNIQAGEYRLSPSSSLGELAKSLTHGTSDLRVTLLEGWRREEMAEELKRQFEAAGSTFDEQAFLNQTANLEGYLFPDTYHLAKTTLAGEIATLLESTFERKVDNSIRSAIETKDLTLKQAVIIASIVEREANLQNERPIVAGILIKRWKNGWPLQADASIQYALGFQTNERSWWKQHLTRADLDIKSPYNTYRQSGLPPSPICNPSLASIQAVANYTDSQYWFYISDLQGNMHYATTIEEHNANIATYLGK